MNKIYWDTIKKYTDNEFELIIIDNASTDGSREFFKSLGGNVKVIENKDNYSYPHCQNQGIQAAKYPVLAFFNNDMFLSPHWDTRMMEVLGKDGYDVLSLASNDRLYDLRTTKRIQRRWKYIKYPLLTLFGRHSFSLKLMTKLCYGNWEKFTEKIYQQYGTSLTVGFSGHAIVMNRTVIDKIGLWDLSQQDADYDLFFRTCQRAEKYGDLKPVSIINGVFTHHYCRLTLYAKHPPFKDKARLIKIVDKWHSGDYDRWMKLAKFDF